MNQEHSQSPMLPHHCTSPCSVRTSYSQGLADMSRYVITAYMMPFISLNAELETPEVQQVLCGLQCSDCGRSTHRRRPLRERAASSAAMRLASAPPNSGQLAGPLPSELSPLAADLKALSAVAAPCQHTASTTSYGLSMHVMFADCHHAPLGRMLSTTIVQSLIAKSVHFAA